jgi:hypothetical protein
MSGFYKNHPDYGGEVDHRELIERLNGYDAWALHTASTTLAQVIALCPPDVRIGAWVKPWASYKPGVGVAYAWEPIIFRGGRKRTREQVTVQDWVACNVTLKKGLTGVKPAAVCCWVFGVLNLEPKDQLHDLYPGSGAVTRAWESWKRQSTLFAQNEKVSHADR